MIFFSSKIPSNLQLIPEFSSPAMLRCFGEVFMRLTSEHYKSLRPGWAPLGYLGPCNVVNVVNVVSM